MSSLVGSPSYVTDTTDAGNGSIAVTIPAGCDCVAVLLAGGDYDPCRFDELNWDDGATQDFTVRLQEDDHDYAYYELNILTMTADDVNWPGTGSQTLYWSTVNDDTFEEGPIIAVIFLQDVDQTNPVRDSESEVGTASPFTSALVSIDAQDLTLGIIVDYQPNTLDVEAGSGQTELFDEPLSGQARLIVGYEQGEDAMVLTTDDDSFVNWSAIAFTDSGGGPAVNSLPLLSNNAGF